MLRKIEINAVLNGFIVQVGCTAVVFESVPKMLEELGKYLADPAATEKAYQTDSINADKLGLARPVDERPVERAARILRDRNVGESLGGIAAGAGAMLGQAIAEGRLADLRTAQAMAEDPGDACVGQGPVGDR
jgi:hypothetical protein